MSLQNWVQQATSYASNLPYRYVALDPGTDTLGVALFSVGHPDPTLIVNNVTTLHGSRLVNNYPHYRLKYGERIARIYALREALGMVYMQWQPHAVIAESPYYRFAAAFAALTECKSAIRESVMSYDPNVPLLFIDPTSAKHAMGVKAKGSNKLAVEEAVINDETICFDPALSRTGHSEHVYDAIAVGKWFYLNRL